MTKPRADGDKIDLLRTHAGLQVRHLKYRDAMAGPLEFLRKSQKRIEVTAYGRANDAVVFQAKSFQRGASIAVRR